MRALIILAIGLSVSACNTTKLNAQDTIALIGAFHKAGCGGAVEIDVQAGAGQLGGQGSASFKAKGECPVGDIPVSETFPEQ